MPGGVHCILRLVNQQKHEDALGCQIRPSRFVIRIGDKVMRRKSRVRGYLTRSTEESHGISPKHAESLKTF